MLEGESEFIGKGKCTVMSVDEAKKESRVYGPKSKDFDDKVAEKQDAQFCDLMVVTFGWKVQKDGSRKLVSKLPNGKILFPDRSEENTHIECGIPYVCLVFERKDKLDEQGNVIEKGREAFAKIIAEDYSPKIYVLPSRMVSVVYRTKSGKLVKKIPAQNTFAERMMEAIQILEEELGEANAKIIFRKNQMPT